MRTRVHASDIINLVVDIEGVEAIRNLQIQAYDKTGRAVGAPAKWTLPVPAGHQPVFLMEASKILFHRAGIPFRAQPSEFKRTLDHLRALHRREVYVEPGQVLPMPMGRWRNLDTHYPVQHDFPETYKIGAAGIAETETPQRIAQARQFKGYLTFFDQVLADYLSQLANLRRIYSLDRKLDRTYFTQYLTEIAGSRKAFEDEFYTDAATLSEDIQRTRLTESEETFLDRRNRVLDHLIARFAERFADYALLQFRLSGDRLRTSADLIGDKIDFLSDYPAMSRNRGMGANLRPENPADVWDSGNISGLERRAGRLMGVEKLTRRALNCAGHFDELFATLKSGNTFRVVIRDRDRKVLFSSAETFADRDEALRAANQAYQGLRREGAFQITESQGTTTYTLAIVSGQAPLTHSKSFDTQMDATQAARAVIARYDELLQSDPCNSEGFHLIEHILLRPRAPGDPLMQVCLPEGCAFCGEEDPYSFRVSVVLPYWPERFRNPHFRDLVERTFREEAPAHVQVRLCWISQAQMTEFDARPPRLADGARRGKPESADRPPDDPPADHAARAAQDGLSRRRVARLRCGRRGNPGPARHQRTRHFLKGTEMEIQTFYPVFENGQVLTSQHLNDIVDYLEPQDRQSRSRLTGIGVICGFEPDWGRGQGDSRARLGRRGHLGGVSDRRGRGADGPRASLSGSDPVRPRRDRRAEKPRAISVPVRRQPSAQGLRAFACRLQARRGRGGAGAADRGHRQGHDSDAVPGVQSRGLEELRRQRLLGQGFRDERDPAPASDPAPIWPMRSWIRRRISPTARSTGPIIPGCNWRPW